MDCRIAIRLDLIVCSLNGNILSHERRYYVTSLDPDKVSAGDLLRLIRGHWQIENSLHFVKDRWWDEDRHHTRRPGLACAFASMTNAAVSVLRILAENFTVLRACAESVQWNPAPIVAALGFTSLEKQ